MGDMGIVRGASRGHAPSGLVGRSRPRRDLCVVTVRAHTAKDGLHSEEMRKLIDRSVQPGLTPFHCHCLFESPHNRQNMTINRI